MQEKGYFLNKIFLSDQFVRHNSKGTSKDDHKSDDRNRFLRLTNLISIISL